MSEASNIRPGEQLDEEGLHAYLQGRLPGAERAMEVRQFRGGAANLTYLLDFEGIEYVLRRPPLGPVPKGAHDMRRESRVLAALPDVYPLAPRALLFCDDLDVLGAEFFVMERRRGVVVRKTLPAAFDAADGPAQLAYALVDALADLHRVDFEAIGLADLGRPEGFVERQVEGWYRRWQATENPTAGMAALYRHLLDCQPPPSRPSLVHNDYKLDNVMFDPADPSRPVAVFDWDMCTLGEPLSDLGALLTYWITPRDPMPAQMMSTMPLHPGFPDREALVAHYAERSGLDVSH
ncbi:MAG: phosphotransferase family protein, partial [Bacteroidota bacterium]